MQNKIIKLLFIFILLFSLPGFSQAPEKSDHPLLDKYYPRQQNADTAKAVTTEIKPVAEAKPVVQPEPVAKLNPVPEPVPVPEKPVAEPEPIAQKEPAPETNPVAEIKPAPEPEPVAETKPLPVVTTTPPIATPDVITPPVNEPATTAIPEAPVKKKVEATQSVPGPVYRPTRLGSSTKQYDTWEKNNNGAGSVTTSPK